MDTNVKYTWVGAFVLGLLTAIILSIVWLSSGFSVGQQAYYKVYMTEAVSGLKLDAPVEYNGVEVGDVSSITINAKNPHQVELILSIRKDIPITVSTEAMLNVRGLTGMAYIALQDKGDNMTPLRPKQGETYPVIQTAPSLLLRLDTALNRVSNNMYQTSNAIQSILDEENQRAFKKIMQNLQHITTILADNSQQLNRLIHHFNHASQQLTPFLQTGADTLRLFQSTTLPIAQQLMNDLDTMAQNLSALASELKQNPALLIRGKVQPTLGPGEK